MRKPAALPLSSMNTAEGAGIHRRLNRAGARPVQQTKDMLIALARKPVCATMELDMPTRRFHRGRSRNKTPALSWLTIAARSSLTFISRRSPAGNQRPSCSARMRRGGLRSIWRSCRSCCLAFKAGAACNEARRIAANIAKLPELVRSTQSPRRRQPKSYLTWPPQDSPRVATIEAISWPSREFRSTCFSISIRAANSAPIFLYDSVIFSASALAFFLSFS
jgi:hypothetical protein